jgi:hypothetical protein
MYKPTREGEFLRELLRDYTGVLISDFYGAYDSLPCPQQKCLIHLMRDLNSPRQPCASGGGWLVEVGEAPAVKGDEDSGCFAPGIGDHQVGSVSKVEID